MGRLFWKFFFFIWLAQLTTAVGVTSFVWLKIRAQEERPVEISQSPPATFMVTSAAATLQFGGPAALKNLLELRERRHFSVLAVDEDNREVLNREVAPTLLKQARQIAAERDVEAVREVKASDGHTYTLFLPTPIRGDRPEGRNEGRNEARNEGRPPEPPEGRMGPGARQDGPPEPPPPGAEQGRGPPPGSGGGPPRRSGLREWMLFPIEPLIVGLLASLAFAALLALYIARPIKSLRNAFDAAAAGKLETRVGPTIGARRDELADLGRDFDRMASRLQGVIEAQRRLLHDVSHEMRSPLARMQAAIGLARQNDPQGAPPKPEKLAAAIERVERETVRIDQLVGELLTLSRLDTGVAGEVLEDINVAELIADIVEDAHFEAQATQREVTLDAGAEGMVHGRAELLHRAFENVIRNAIKHTGAGTSVTVGTRFGSAGQLQVVVQDAGPGVPPDELEAIFTPFVRGRYSSGTEGHGLGLAIARRVLEAHGGSIRALNRPEGGLRVEMVLPLAGKGAA